METLTSWINANLKIFYLALLAQILLTESSPLSKDTRSETKVCAEGWIHYQRFCVTGAKGDSETAVALYCHGFGGIGVKGYCIVKAHNADEARSKNLGDALLQAASGKAGHDNIGDLMDSSEDVAQGMGAGSSDQYDKDIEEIACPKGWKHYGKICVYQPMSIQDQCHMLDAVEFSGLCLKHADTAAVARRGLKYNYSGKEKRVCCCAHVSATPNGYGCI